jgi:hypothetical protein
MQLPIYQSEEEQRLMVELWSPALADDPEAFVLFAFPVGPEEHTAAQVQRPTQVAARGAARHQGAHCRQQRQGADGHPARGVSVADAGLASQP